MRSLYLAAVTAICCLAFAGTTLAADVAFPQVYPKSVFVVKDREKLGGSGLGTIHCEYAFPRDKALKEQAIKEIAWLTLPPGATIGLHKHEANEDAYVVVAGHGVFIDASGKETKVKKGDVTIARKGEAHAMKNTGKTPFVLLDVVAQQ